jgi:hypothetical protein
LKFSNVSAKILVAIFRVNMLVGRFWGLYIGQTVGDEWDMTDLLPALGSPKCPINIFTLKMTTAVFAEMLDNFQHLTRLIPKSRSFTIIKICLSVVQSFHAYGRVAGTI